MLRSPGWIPFPIALALSLGPFAVAADLEPEPVGVVRKLPAEPGPHWFWLSDIVLHRTALFDGDTGELLGAIHSGTAGVGFVIEPLFSPDHREIHIAETYYSRGVRGERTDVVTTYDAQTLAPVGEIGIPAKRAEYFPGNAANALSDDGRFLAVFNLTPATSLTIVDLEKDRVAGEVPASGCGLVFASGPRQFFMLCADGTALVVSLGDDGSATAVERTESFFRPMKEPLTEKAVRRGDEWIFVSFEGKIQPVDVRGDGVRPGKPWSLFDEADRRANWRVGGQQHLAIHEESGTLYVLVHQGEEDTHKDPGTEVWMYDLATHKRIRRLPLQSPLVSFLGVQAGLGEWARRILGWFVENPGVDRILVTQDDEPILVTSATLPPTLTIYDARTGDLLREVSEPGIAASLLYAP